MSNKEIGDKFRDTVKKYLSIQGHKLEPEYGVEIGYGQSKKIHYFDLGNELDLIECKKYSWTEGGNNPSAKLSTLIEAVHIYCAAPKSYNKKIFVFKTSKKGIRNPETLVEYFIRSYGHLIPEDIEIWEFDDINMTSELKYGKNSEQAPLGCI
jgi:hypothetical protein